MILSTVSRSSEHKYNNRVEGWTRDFRPEKLKAHKKNPEQKSVEFQIWQLYGMHPNPPTNKPIACFIAAQLGQILSQ